MNLIEQFMTDRRISLRLNVIYGPINIHIINLYTYLKIIMYNIIKMIVYTRCHSYWGGGDDLYH